MVSYYDDLVNISYRISEVEINCSKIIIVIIILALGSQLLESGLPYFTS